MANRVVLAFVGVILVSASVQAEPSPTPTNLQASTQSDGVNLTWTGSDKALGYVVYRNNASIGETTSMQFLDANGVAGDVYEVSAISKHGESARSEPATAQESAQASSAMATQPGGNRQPPDCFGISQGWPPVFVNPESCLQEIVHPVPG